MDPQPRLHPTTPGQAAARVAVTTSAPDVAFAHASEAELARILDFYGVAWQYEPHTFPLMWNLRGEVVESFTPDFFLPELDLHVELTTLRQKLVRKKNRKLRRMRDLYPDVRVKLLYGKDFRALLLKFGRIGLADALSGTVGQTTPPRSAGRPPTAERSRRPASDAGRARAAGWVEAAGTPDGSSPGGDPGASPGGSPSPARRTSRAGGAPRRGGTRRPGGRPAAAEGGTHAATDAGPGTAARRPRTAG